MSIGSGGSTVGSGKPGLNSSLSGGINFSSGKDKDSPWLMNGDLSYGFNERKVRRSSIRQYYLQAGRNQRGGKVQNRGAECFCLCDPEEMLKKAVFTEAYDEMVLVRDIGCQARQHNDGDNDSE